MKTVALQFVRESDGQLYRQELAWASDEGYTGRFNPEHAVEIPKGAAKLDVAEIEWEPCTEGETVVDAWIVGVDDSTCHNIR